ncbi:M18 family aminopeptidase [Marinomonas piezotolerans]|uniref:M18 family aminopeptidase n=1 Tax=Marinomonas piezotolerans TaxID=2213058 RepID=A0A370U808_9GAMM|nr:M18 family aminopeptidase [Marinomonas piezotolerans]RDL43893.1 M18 family aminopeptidase [Marinomonas piezotolerans]
MNQASFNQSLLSFLDDSPTPFHAVSAMKYSLLDAGYEELDEQQEWVISEGGRYFVTRNDSSIIAFTAPSLDFAHQGFRMIGAHTDSPCLKVKPNAHLERFGHHQLGVEVYGGVLMHTWLDRDLSIAGRVTFKTEDGILTSRLIDFKEPIALVPNVAIHLNRGVNSDGFKVNPQEEILPILCGADNDFDFEAILTEQIRREHSDVSVASVLSFELCLYDVQKAAVTGLKEEYISASRLDNLLSCYVGLQALLASEEKRPTMLICTDHEEVGSQSACGANGPFLEDVLRRLTPSPEQYTQAIQRSMLVSADNAHALHPNYASKHDQLHAPLINKGAVIKVNNNQRYATNSETTAVYKNLALEAGFAVQTFVVRSDMACGSTIGPITAGEIGVATLDIGLPTFAMHSIRELAGCDDAFNLYQVLVLFSQCDQLISK